MNIQLELNMNDAAPSILVSKSAPVPICSDRWRYAVPVEIIEEIISCLLAQMHTRIAYSDYRAIRKTLLACTQACHALHDFSHRALCSNLCFESRDQASALAFAARRSEDVKKCLNETRQMILINTHSQKIAPLQFAHPLPKLTTLRMFGQPPAMKIERPREGDGKNFASIFAFRFVSTLYLTDYVFKSFTDFQVLVVELPQLSKVDLKSCSCADGQYEVNYRYVRWPKRPRLTSLSTSLCVDMTSAVHSWLSRTPTGRSIRTLRMQYRPALTFDIEMYSLLKVPRSTLSCLELNELVPSGSFLPGPDPNHYADALDLITSKRIRTIQIQFPCLIQDKRTTLDNAFRRIHSWRVLDDSFLAEPFDSLETVFIIVGLKVLNSTPYDEADVRRAIEERLPILHARGILRVKVKNFEGGQNLK